MEQLMVTGEQMAELALGTAPAFIFRCDGIVQHWHQNRHVGMLVATNRAAADVMAAKLTTNNGREVSVWEVGKMEGDTLANRIAASVVAGGANGLFVTDDGQTVQWFDAPPALTM